jgi:hypothetical protein
VSSLAQAVVTLGIVLTVLLAAVLIGEAIYHWGDRALRKRFGRGSHFKGGAFELGEQEVSEGVEALIEDIGSVPVTKCLRRHHSGDWGEIDDENRDLNRVSLREGGGLGFESAYLMEGGTVLWIITFGARLGTILLTEDEYRQVIDEEYEECQLYVRPLSECLLEQDPSKQHQSA